LEEEIENSKLKIENSSSTTMTVVKLPVNGGLTKALNEGLKYVTGDLIARMDSDDISETHRFERQVAYLAAHPDVDIISGSLQEFDTEHECLNVRHYPQTHEECVKFIVKACPLAHPSVMIRKTEIIQPQETKLPIKAHHLIVIDRSICIFITLEKLLYDHFRVFGPFICPLS
jgi:glycosyltransferase involved in cell wall biosynthesis